MARWFGKSWGAPVCDPKNQAPTPVGDKCDRCGIQILIPDQGIIIPYMSKQIGIVAYHRDCWFAEIGVPGFAEHHPRVHDPPG